MNRWPAILLPHLLLAIDIDYIRVFPMYLVAGIDFVLLKNDVAARAFTCLIDDFA